MENWIEKIKEFIRKAMNEGYIVRAYTYTMADFSKMYELIICNKEENKVKITIDNCLVVINTHTGTASINKNFTKRDLLELDAILLSIEEYNEDMAMMEFSNFFGDEDNKPTTIDNLDDDD